MGLEPPMSPGWISENYGFQDFFGAETPPRQIPEYAALAGCNLKSLETVISIKILE